MMSLEYYVIEKLWRGKPHGCGLFLMINAEPRRGKPKPSVPS